VLTRDKNGLPVLLLPVLKELEFQSHSPGGATMSIYVDPAVGKSRNQR